MNDLVSAEIWADEDGVIRRMTGTSKVPAAGGTPAGSFTLTHFLHDFGTELDTTGPPDSEVYDGCPFSLISVERSLPST